MGKSANGFSCYEINQIYTLKVVPHLHNSARLLSTLNQRLQELWIRDQFSRTFFLWIFSEYVKRTFAVDFVIGQSNPSWRTRGCRGHESAHWVVLDEEHELAADVQAV